VDEESEDEDYDHEEEQGASLQQRIDELHAEKTGLLALNSELQKKAVALIAKEKAMQGQTAAARTAAEVSVVQRVRGTAKHCGLWYAVK
jgi:choline kinase